MAGQQLTRTRLNKLRAIGPEGEEQVLVWVASGMPMSQILRQLGLGKDNRVLYKWRDEDEARRAAWDEAMLYRAEHLAEESLDIADDVVEDPDAIRKAELQIKVRHWLSAVYNPSRYGKDTNRTVVNIENLHLTAVEAYNAQIQAKAVLALAEKNGTIAAVQGEDVEDADFEFLSDDDIEDLL